MSRMDVMCKFAFDVANDDSHGYTQGAGRMGPTDYDCAGLCITAARKAGYPTGGATYTGDMIPTMTSAGWTKLPYSRAALKRGDMEIRPKTATRGGHVALCIDDTKSPKVIVEAYMNEKGGAIGGKPGDQTGNEIRVTGDYAFGTYILRPPADPAPAPAPKPKPTVVPKAQPDEVISVIRQGTVHRLYNPENGDHMYTTNEAEHKALPKQGWKDEGSLGTAPEGYAVVYRLVNVSSGEHLWTDDFDEAKSLLGQGQNLSDGTKQGWQFEGDAFIAHDGDQGAVKLHRLYKRGGFHLLSSDEGEITALVNDGWKDEGVKFSLDRP